MQHLNTWGQKLWGDSGMTLRSDSVIRTRPFATRDCQQGVIVLWSETRQSAPIIVGQRLDPDGHCLWSQPGVTIGSGGVSSLSPVDNGSVFVLYAPPFDGIWAQRLDLDGHLVWATRFDPSGYNLFLFPYTVVGDGRGGAYTTWLWVNVQIRQRQPYYISHEAFCHLDSTGANGGQYFVLQEEGYGSSGTSEPVINCLPDTGGAAILAWTSIQQGGAVVYSRALDSSLVWPTRTAASSYSSTSIRLVPDNAGGAIICFRAPYNSIRVQRVSSTGPLWGTAGVVVDNSPGSAIAEDDSSGAVVVCGVVNFGALKANRFRADGSRAWQVRLCPESDSVGDYSVVNDHCGGAIAVWAGKRYDGWTIFAQRLNLGALGVGEGNPRVATEPLLSVLGSPGRNRFGFMLRQSGSAELAIYSGTGRRVWTARLNNAREGTQVVRWDGTDDSGDRFAPGVYVCNVRTGSGRTQSVPLVLLR
jgi:hypothetical protein